MQFSRNEIRALLMITRSEEPVRSLDLLGLGLQRETVSRIITRLKEKGLVERKKGEIVQAMSPPAEAFKRLYFAHRASPMQNLLADRRVELLFRLDHEPKSLEALARETAIPSNTVYNYLKGFLHLGVVDRSKKGKAYLYSFNYVLWSELKDFVTTLFEYHALHLIPRDALLIKSYGYRVLFKSLRPHDATPTSFSVYGNYGIELGLRDNYYTLPKRELSPAEIFIHSLDSAKSISQRLYCILFYLKNREQLVSVLHPMMKSIRSVLGGERIKGYPTLEEVKEQAELYGITDIESGRGRRNTEKIRRARGPAHPGPGHRRRGHAGVRS